MVSTLPAYADILTNAISALQGTMVTTVNGQRIPLDTQPGSFNLSIATAIALTQAAFYSRQSDIQNALTLPTAQGTDLDALVALLGIVRNAAGQSQVPVLFTRKTPTSSTVSIAVGTRIVAYDATSQPTIIYDLLQGAGLPPGVGALLPSNGASAWGLALAEVAGAAGNIGNNAIAALGSPIAGIDTVSNPSASTPNQPTATVTGIAGTTSVQYKIVGLGATGLTLPSTASTVLTTAPNTLTGVNFVVVSWTNGTGGAGLPPVSYDVLKLVSGSYLFIGNTTTLTFSDVGQTPIPYAMPLMATTNQGVGGVDSESDTALRARAPQSVATRSTSTGAALIAAADTVTNVQSSFYVDSATPGAGTLSLVANSYPLSPLQIKQVGTLIAATKAAGAQITVTTIAPTLVDVSYTYAVLLSVANPASLQPAIKTAIQAFFGSLAPSAPIRYSTVISSILSVLGVTAVTSLLLQPQGGTAYTNQDVPSVAGVLYSVGVVTPTVGS